jgi:hypothetical protein
MKTIVASKNFALLAFVTSEKIEDSWSQRDQSASNCSSLPNFPPYRNRRRKHARKRKINLERVNANEAWLFQSLITRSVCLIITESKPRLSDPTIRQETNALNGTRVDSRRASLGNGSRKFGP